MGWHEDGNHDATGIMKGMMMRMRVRMGFRQASRDGTQDTEERLQRLRTPGAAATPEKLDDVAKSLCTYVSVANSPKFKRNTT